jgi:hypothetical protein
MDIELDILSLVLLALILVVIVVPLFFPSDPDTFPFILHNRSQPSKVRHPKESAIYRHRDQPHGYPLITGLALRKGYEAPRDGDLRDVWDLGIQKGVTLGIVRGGRCAFEKLENRQEELKKLGSGLRHLAGEGGKVAIYLPNTIENLLASFGEIVMSSQANRSMCIPRADGCRFAFHYNSTQPAECTRRSHRDA